MKKVVIVGGGIAGMTAGILLQKAGFTTPDANEALIKKTALGQCRKGYILSDASKFDHVSSVTFAALHDAVILTDRRPEGYQDCDNIIEIKNRS